MNTDELEEVLAWLKGHNDDKEKVKRTELVEYIAKNYGYKESYISVIILPILKAKGLKMAHEKGCWRAYYDGD